MTPTLSAYIDMEFAGIYGTRQGMQIPIEIGVVLHDPDNDSLTFAGKPFCQDIHVELWKNITDDLGKRAGGKQRVFNLTDTAILKSFDKKFHLDNEGKQKAREAVNAVHSDLRAFMQALNHKKIGTLVFFARRREMDSFRRSRVNTEGFLIRDLQEEIRERFALQEHVSLDRMSLVAGFGMDSTSICSTHFSYTIPKNFRYVIRPHKAIGDAARMFLVSLEFSRHDKEFGERIKEHLAQYNHRKQAQKEVQPGDP
jgi:hypothetical protein